MPTYDYVCDGCGHKFEQFQSIKADALKDCPSCGKPLLRRLIGAGAGFLFKGSGFYLTDYRSESYKSGEKSASGGDKPAGDAKPSTDAKPAEAKPAASESKPAAAEPKPAPKAEPKPAAKSE